MHRLLSFALLIIILLFPRMSCITWRKFDWKKTIDVREMQHSDDAVSYHVTIGIPSQLMNAADSVRYHFYNGSLDSLILIHTVTVDGSGEWIPHTLVEAEDTIWHSSPADGAEPELFMNLNFHRKNRTHETHPDKVNNN